MSDLREKKKLRLMNEVLPDPTLIAAPGGPRQRVLATVSRLGAMAAAMASTQVGCSGEQSQPGGGAQVTPTVDIPGTGAQVTPTVDVPGTSATGGPIASSSSTATVTPPSSATATNVPRLPPSYAVVDPMPPPATCMGVAQSISPTAQWKPKKGGGFTVEVKLPRPGRADASYGGQNQPSAWGGKIAAQQIAADSVVITLEPTAGETLAGISIPAVCSQGNGHISVRLDLSKPPTAQGAVPITLRDSY